MMVFLNPRWISPKHFIFFRFYKIDDLLRYGRL